MGEHPWIGSLPSGTACGHATLSYLDIHALVRLSLRILHFSSDYEFGGRFRMTPALLTCIYPITRHFHQLTHSTPSFSTPAFSTPAIWCRVFHSRVFSAPAVNPTGVNLRTAMAWMATQRFNPSLHCKVCSGHSYSSRGPVCPHCGRICVSDFGLRSNLRVHL